MTLLKHSEEKEKICMENLMINETDNFNLENMSDEQLEVFTNKALFIRQKKADKKIEELANKQAKIRGGGEN